MPKKKDEERVRLAESLRGENHTKILNNEGEFHVKCEMHSADSSCQEVSIRPVESSQRRRKSTPRIQPSGGFSFKGNVFGWEDWPIISYQVL